MVSLKGGKKDVVICIKYLIIILLTAASYHVANFLPTKKLAGAVTYPVRFQPIGSEEGN